MAEQRALARIRCQPATPCRLAAKCASDFYQRISERMQNSLGESLRDKRMPGARAGLCRVELRRVLLILCALQPRHGGGLVAGQAVKRCAALEALWRRRHMHARPSGRGVVRMGDSVATTRVAVGGPRAGPAQAEGGGAPNPHTALGVGRSDGSKQRRVEK